MISLNTFKSPSVSFRARNSWGPDQRERYSVAREFYTAIQNNDMIGMYEADGRIHLVTDEKASNLQVTIDNRRHESLVVMKKIDIDA